MVTFQYPRHQDFQSETFKKGMHSTARVTVSQAWVYGVRRHQDQWLFIL